MQNPVVTAAGNDMVFEYQREGLGSKASTAALKMINEEEFYRVMKKRGDNPLDDLSSDEDEF